MKRIDRRTLSVPDRVDLDLACERAAERRERNAALGRCINDVTAHTHEPPRTGRTKCDWCLAVASVGVERAAKSLVAPVRVRLSHAATAVVGGGHSDVQVEQAINKALNEEERTN